MAYRKSSPVMTTSRERLITFDHIFLSSESPSVPLELRARRRTSAAMSASHELAAHLDVAPNGWSVTAAAPSASPSSIAVPWIARMWKAQAVPCEPARVLQY